MKTMRFPAVLCLSMISLSSFSAWAGSPQDWTLPCLDMFYQRKKGEIAETTIVPIAGAAATVGGVYAGEFIGTAAARSNQNQNTGGLADSTAGAIAGGAVVATVAVGIEIVSALHLSATERMHSLVKEVEVGSGSSIDQYFKKFIRRHPKLKNKVTQDQMVKQIFELDQKRALCDGSLKTRKPAPYETRLAKLLVTPRELDHALASEFKETNP